MARARNPPKKSEPKFGFCVTYSNSSRSMTRFNSRSATSVKRSSRSKRSRLPRSARDIGMGEVVEQRGLADPALTDDGGAFAGAGEQPSADLADFCLPAN